MQRQAPSSSQPANVCLSVCGVGGSGKEELKKGPVSSPAALRFVNVCKKNSDREERYQYL